MYTNKITINKSALIKGLKEVKISYQKTSHPIFNHVKLSVYNDVAILQTVIWESETVKQSAGIRVTNQTQQFAICLPMVNRYKKYNPGLKTVTGYPLLDYLKQVESEYISLEFNFNMSLVKITPLEEGIKTSSEFKCIDAAEFPCNKII